MSDQNPHLKDLYYKVGNLEGQINQLDKNIDIRFADLGKRLDVVIKNHEDRINKVEEDCAIVKTKSGIIGGIAGFIVSVIAVIIAYFQGK